MRPRLGRLLLAVTLGVLSLTSALALAGVSAWLITRAWQMPPVLDLSVAVVAVRAFGISRGVLHYCERLASHDTALRAAGSARRGIYHRLARGPVDVTARLHAGELVGRVGSDVDELADAVVRAVLPIAVATVLSLIAVGVIAVISLPAAALLAACLLIAGVVAPWLAARGATAQEELARIHHGDRDITAMLALEHAPELRVSGRLPAIIAESGQRQRDWAKAVDRAATPGAYGAAVPTAAMGVGVLGAVIIGIGISGTVAPTTLAILMLLPLSSFEATTALPGAAIQLTRSRIAARRLLALTGSGAVATVIASATPRDSALRGTALRAGHPGSSPGSVVSLDLKPGARLAVTGPSGSGKSTLLMTIAGLLPPIAGDLTIGGVPIGTVDEHQLHSWVAYFAEDAHIFATTVRDNLLVVRGDCGDDELTTALTRVGLGDWLQALPDGLATVLTGGASAVSAGQRRRLLLARALLCRAPVLLLDEPTEHLDAADAEALLRQLLVVEGGLLEPGRTVVVATHHLPGDITCPRLHTQASRYSGSGSRPPQPDLERTQ
ncbi:thiol reductant ABC exporter subunit CydC [Mycolicibacterium komossense]|uniref:Thiol reductant ABC exporter subunit CydC n=1 Tax=Mycolicibacterium komossense TaxID=1779 RepID=A0ABT3CB74_9MYCO|nr:thiol reductant ABC exporter subunit CydC [Mycolicibacterium komossense]